MEAMINSLGMRMNFIPAGTFMMGSPAGEEGRSKMDGAYHQVTLTCDFYLGTTEVTQGQWQSLMGTTPWRGKNDVL